MTTSLCMIVKNEADVLGRCLDSVAGIFDEIVIADTGSTDATRDIALRYTDKVYDFPWINDFSAARNFAFSKASGDYLMWLDADDVIEGDNKARLKSLLQGLDTLRPDVVMLPYDVLFDGDGRVLLSYERARILRAGEFFFVGEVHEAVVPHGKILHGDAAVSHRKLKENEPFRNLKIFEETAKKRVLEPRMRYYFARELKTADRLDEAAEQYLLCADDPSAWVENRVSAYFELSQLYAEKALTDDSEKALLKALSLDSPRADICCEMGRRFMDKGNLDAARFWYELAPRQFSAKKGGFVNADFGGYIPYLQLCVICDRLGQTEMAEKYNELAGKHRPSGAAYLYNKKYFEELRRKQENL